MFCINVVHGENHFMQSFLYIGRAEAQRRAVWLCECAALIGGRSVDDGHPDARTEGHAVERSPSAAAGHFCVRDLCAGCGVRFEKDEVGIVTLADETSAVEPEQACRIVGHEFGYAFRADGGEFGFGVGQFEHGP